MREEIPSTGRHRKLAQLPRNPPAKEKKKKSKQTNPSKQRGHSTTTLQNSDNTEKLQTKASPQETLSISPPCNGQLGSQRSKAGACSKKNGGKGGGGGGGCGQRSKKKSKATTAPPPTDINKHSDCGVPLQGAVARPSAQGKESLRWEGVLEDPLAEEKRLELYRANRRQRYLAHRQALLEETQTAQRQTT